MTLNTWKAAIALVALVCITVLMATSHLDSDAGVPIITMIVGYSIGNGIASTGGKDVEPIIKRKPTKKDDEPPTP